MPVTAITTDPDAPTMTVVADVAAPPAEVWDAYVDPRRLERFWGPPTHPARFTRHDAAVGGRSDYAMSGPEGDIHHGYWEWLALDPQRSFDVRDGFAAEDGTPLHSLPQTRMRVVFEPSPEGTRVTAISRFGSTQDLERLLGMGVAEGMRAALGQLDDVAADRHSFAAGRATMTQPIHGRQARISRVIRAGIADVWRAYHEPELLKRWLLGPDGWSMPVCEVPAAVGDSFRYEWQKGDDRFGFTGELLESVPPHREVTTERMIGTPGQTVNEMTLTPVEGGTLMSLVITYPDAEFRDAVLSGDMAEGMEASMRRLESEVLPAA